MTYRADFAKPSDKEELKAIYNICFPNEEGFADWYFEKVWEPRRTSVIRENGRVIAMFHALDVCFEHKGKRGEGLYLFALGTLPEKRGMRLGLKLYEFWFDYCRKNGLEFVSVLAAHEGLVDYYCLCGMSAAFCITESKIPAAKGRFITLSNRHIPQMNEIYDVSTGPYFRERRCISRWNDIMLWYDAYGVEEDGKLKAYCFGEVRNGVFYVLEAFGEGAETLVSAAAFGKDFGEAILRRPAALENGRATGNIIFFSDELKELADGASLTYLNMYFN